ncbi:MAG: TAXI family TRAP transporter solute-binding subunit [Firmicutes bacterium]|nr:TAXI family TRAP transporter solute-binding subunit [Bacillota bacterium]
MLKGKYIIFILFFAIFILGGCAQEFQPVTNISIGTAPVEGSFYPVGVAMADVLNKNLTGVQITAEETGGSAENLALIDEGRIELGFSAGESVAKAIAGEEPFTKKTEILLGWVLFPIPFQPVALKETGIKSISDLEGKKVSIGAPGATVNITAKELLKAHGVDINKVSFMYLGWGEAADALADRKIDAAFFQAAIPSPAIEGLAARMPVQLLETDTTILERDFADQALFPGILPKNSYPGQEEDVAWPFDYAYAFFSPRLDEKIVYDITKTIFENKDIIEKAHPKGKEMHLIDKASADKIGLEIHPGAIRYAKEIGIWE